METLKKRPKSVDNVIDNDYHYHVLTGLIEEEGHDANHKSFRFQPYGDLVRTLPIESSALSAHVDGYESRSIRQEVTLP